MCVVTLTLILRLFLGGAGGFTQLTWIDHTASWLAETEKKNPQNPLTQIILFGCFYFQTPRMNDFHSVQYCCFCHKNQTYVHINWCVQAKRKYYFNLTCWTTHAHTIYEGFVSFLVGNGYISNTNCRFTFLKTQEQAMDKVCKRVRSSWDCCRPPQVKLTMSWEDQQDYSYEHLFQIFNPASVTWCSDI